jgi:hypothetical protein
MVVDSKSTNQVNPGRKGHETVEVSHGPTAVKERVITIPWPAASPDNLPAVVDAVCDARGAWIAGARTQINHGPAAVQKRVGTTLKIRVPYNLPLVVNAISNTV